MRGIILMLAAIVVGLLMCACGGRKEMSNRVIVQNETFTLTGDSVIEDSVIAFCPTPTSIESNVSLRRLDSLYGDVDSSQVRFVQGKQCT